MRYTIFILSLLLPFLSIVAQPKHEVRAAWVTAVYGLDWPRTRATTPQTIRKQKEELIDILDKLVPPVVQSSSFMSPQAERCITMERMLRKSKAAILRNSAGMYR